MRWNLGVQYSGPNAVVVLTGNIIGMINVPGAIICSYGVVVVLCGNMWVFLPIAIIINWPAVAAAAAAAGWLTRCKRACYLLGRDKSHMECLPMCVNKSSLNLLGKSGGWPHHLMRFLTHWVGDGIFPPDTAITFADKTKDIPDICQALK